MFPELWPAFRSRPRYIAPIQFNCFVLQFSEMINAHISNLSVLSIDVLSYFTFCHSVSRRSVRSRLHLRVYLRVNDSNVELIFPFRLAAIFARFSLSKHRRPETSASLKVMRAMRNCPFYRGPLMRAEIERRTSGAIMGRINKYLLIRT